MCIRGNSLNLRTISVMYILSYYANEGSKTWNNNTNNESIDGPCDKIIWVIPY